MRKQNKVIAGIAAGALVVASAGVAYAYWTTEGAGTGSATAASNNAQKLAITSTAPAAAVLVPGSNHTIDVKVVNPNSGSAYANTVSGVVSLVGGDKTNCKAADFSVDPITAFGTIPTGTTGVTKSTTLRFASTNENQNDCKNIGLSIAWSNDVGQVQ